MRFRKRKAAGPAPAVAAAVPPETPIPAGSLIATRTGKIAHVKSGLPGEPGARCEAMRLWTDWRIVGSDEEMGLCHRCDLATRASSGEQAT
jgi:hypothetical protein